MGRARAPAAEAGKARRRPACHTRPRGAQAGSPRLALDEQQQLEQDLLMYLQFFKMVMLE
jgi:hypothetical protein